MNQSLHLVAGLGKTGQSIAGYLHRRNLPFVVYDTRSQLDGLEDFKRHFPDVRVYFGEFPSDLYPQITSIVASPGIPVDAPFLLEARRRGIPVQGDIECLAREIQAPVVAITGTNGKSTVTSLVGEMAKEARLKVAVAGNIGLPVLDLLDDGAAYDMWVLELSSFQLDLIDSLKPVASCILNISPDHLDRHHTIEAYVAAKQRIYTDSRTCIFNRQDMLTQPVHSTGSICSYGLDAPEGDNWGIVKQQGVSFLCKGNKPLLAVDQLKIKGLHNWQNALAACALADAAGIDSRHMVTVLTRFPGLPHRCQWVRTLDDVEWINDSKGTNIGATLSAISGIGPGLRGKIILIAGGLGKGADFTGLRDCVSEHTRAAILIGADADKIELAWSGATSIYRAGSLEDAVKQARALAQPGDVVLLSPACASQDMFRDFNHRGEAFAQLAGSL